MSVVTLVRHGEAVGNLDHRFIGQDDVELSQEGHRQARLVANRLAASQVEAIVSSDLRRCVDTARPLSDMLGITIDIDPRFREISNGEWTSLTAGEIEAGWPDLWQRYHAGEDVQRPGGETWAEVTDRALAALADLDPSRRTVVFSHGGPTLAAALWAAGVAAPGNIFRGPLAPVANASLTTLALSPPRLVALNDIGHLQTDPSADLPIWDRPQALDE